MRSLPARSTTLSTAAHESMGMIFHHGNFQVGTDLEGFELACRFSRENTLRRITRRWLTVLIHESVLPLDRSSPPAEAPADRLNSANEPTDHAAVSRAEKSRTECEFAARHAIVTNACSSWSPHTPSSACPRRKSAHQRCAVIRRPHPQAEAERLMRIGQVRDRS